MDKLFNPDVETFGQIGDVDVVTIGPYNVRVLVDAEGYHSGYDGGDHSTAFLELYVDGVLSKRVEDWRFNTYNLRIRKRLWLERGSQIVLQVKGGNRGATTDSLGVRGWITPLG
ncbi:MAG: hypothetical protein O9296_06980 [Novosphingobium sp.]|jgi:hypothetical protein|nr:hypothetical protein [Novosphingobium sp.]